MISACENRVSVSNSPLVRGEHTEHKSIRARGIDRCLEPDICVNHRVKVDISLQHIPDISPLLQLARILQVCIMSDAAFDPASEKRERATAVRNENVQPGKAIKDSAE